MESAPCCKSINLSRSLAAFDPISTLVVVVEMSKTSWLVSGVVPGVERRPLKKLEPWWQSRRWRKRMRSARAASARALSTSVHASSTA
jgi:transposase